jgi:hypothetical protein
MRPTSPDLPSTLPGFEPDEWLKKLNQCTKDDEQAISELEDCYITKAGELITYSDEPAETVATAVAGVCSTTYGRLIVQLAKCVGGYPRAENLAEEAAKRFREKIIAAVVLQRAKNRQQQQLTR